MKKISLTFLFLLLAVALLVSTCGRNGPLPPPDKTAPAVSTSIPADGEEIVALNTSIIITFTKEMNPATLNNKTILVSSYGGVAVEGTVSATGMTAVFKPTQLLAQNTHYAVTIDGTVMDTYGIPMGSPTAISFWTETLPSVVSHLPGIGVIEVPVNSTINVVFSEPVDPSTINFTLLSAITGTVECTMTTLDNVSYTFTPVIPFGAVYGMTGNTLYTVIVHAGVTDNYGKVMAQDVTWSFTTALAPDTTPPVVSAVTPTNGSSNVSVSTGITVTFSELLTSQSMTVLLSGGTGAPITCIQDGEDTTVNQTIAYFAPLVPPSPGRLEYHTLYSATLLKDGVIDLSGIPMSTNYVWTFTTALATTSTIISAPSIAFGSNGIVTVIVSADDQTAGAPTGNVWLSVDNQSSTQQPLSPGAGATATATFTIINPSSGSHPLAATYQTQGIFSTSTGTSILTVNTGAGTTTTLQSSVNPSAFGQSVMFTATVTPTTATGTVWFIDSTTTTTLGSGTLSRGNPNTATFSTTSLAAGAHAIVARYVGDANFPGGSQSAPLTQTVVNASSTTNLTQSSATAVYGTNVTFTATVTGPGGTPTGTVTFSDGVNWTASAALSNGIASVSTTALTGGQRTITATYGGDASYGQSSKSVVHTVTNQPTTTGPVTSSANPSTFGSSITFTAAVTSNPTGSTPSGTVTFSNGGSWTASAALSNGSASVSTSALPYGPNSITAVFNPGNTYYATSTSAALVQNVNPVITASAGTGGSISPSGAITVPYGTNQTFTITPSTCYSIASVLVDGFSQTITNPTSFTYQFTNVTANHTIVANFVINTFTITPSAGPNGSINPATPQTVNCGSNMTFTFTPNPNYFISAVTVDTANVGLPTSYTFINVTANHTIGVSFALGTNIITATAGAGGTINSQGVIVSSGTSQDFLVANGGSRQFAITPNAGYSIASIVSDGVTTTTNPYTFSNVTSNHTIVANFVINTYAVNLSASGPAGSGTVSPASSMVSYGSTTTFTVTPSAGYTAVMSGNCGGSLVGTTYTTGPITGACSETATFSPNPYTLTVTKGGTGTGSVTPNTGTLTWNGNTGTGTYNYGTSVTLTPAADISSTFGGWTGCDSVNGNQCIVSINAARSVSATFTINTYLVGVTASGSGTVSPASAMVSYGSTTTFTVTPSAGYTAVMSGNCGGSLVGTTYTTGPITGACSETATFSINPYVLTVTKGGTGTGSVTPNTGTLTWVGNTGTGTYNYGASVTLTPAADISSTFGGWTGCDSVNGNQCIVSINAARNVSAAFTINTYSVGVTASGSGTVSPASAMVSYGSTTTFTVTPSAGYTAAMSGNCGGALVGTTYTTGPITGACSETATFTIQTFTITTIATNCTITPQNPSVPYNANQTFTITPNTGYHLANVLVDGYSVGAVSSYTFTKVKDVHTIEADCAINTYTLTASAGTGGSITPSGTTTLNYNGSQTFTITPNSSYSVLDVLVDGSSVGAVTSYPFNSVTANHTISATFVLSPIITASVVGQGNINPLGAVTVNYGSNSPQFIIQPQNTNFSITQVLVDGVPQAITDPQLFTYTFYTVTSNHSIDATIQ